MLGCGLLGGSVTRLTLCILVNFSTLYVYTYRSIFLHHTETENCGKMWERTVLDEEKLGGDERRMIRMMCGVRLVDSVLTDVGRDRVGAVGKVEEMISRLRWYGHVIRRDISSQICEVMVLVCKERSGTIWFEKRGCVRSREMVRAN